MLQQGRFGILEMGPVNVSTCRRRPESHTITPVVVYPLGRVMTRCHVRIRLGLVRSLELRVLEQDLLHVGRRELVDLKKRSDPR